MGIPSVDQTEPECGSIQESTDLDLKKTDVSLIKKIKEAIRKISLGIKEKILQPISSFIRSNTDGVFKEELLFEKDETGEITTEEKFRRIRQKLLLQRKRKQRQSLTGGRLLAALVFFSSFVMAFGRPISVDTNTLGFGMKVINMEETKIEWTSSEAPDMLTFTICKDAEYSSDCKSFTAYMYESEFIINYRKLALSPFTEYRVYAKLNTQIVFDLELKTPATAPEKPENFSCHRVNGSIVFSWRQPKVSNGPLSGYRIIVQEQKCPPISAFIKNREVKFPEIYLKEPFTAELVAYNEQNGEQILGSAVQISGCETVSPTESSEGITEISHEDPMSISGTTTPKDYTIFYVIGVACAILSMALIANRCYRKKCTPNKKEEKAPRDEKDCFTTVKMTDSYKKIKQTLNECI